MSSHKVYIPFSKDAIKKLSNMFNSMAVELPKLEKLILNRSLDYLFERAAYHIQESTGNSGYMPTGELLAGLKEDKELNRVFNDCAHAKWVEYGTGIVGQGTYPQQLPSGYAYDVNNHGEEGWTYKGNDGNYYHTTGMVAHHFMYDAIIDFKQHFKVLSSQCFDEWIGGILK